MVCFVVEEEKLAAPGLVGNLEDDSAEESGEERGRKSSPGGEKMARRLTYLVAAAMSSFGITSMAVYRFTWQMEGGEVPYTEMFGTFALSFGAVVGMDFWARWAHEALWHASLWHMHEDLELTKVPKSTPDKLLAGDENEKVEGKGSGFIWDKFGQISHHKPREGPLELNDVFAIINS